MIEDEARELQDEWIAYANYLIANGNTKDGLFMHTALLAKGSALIERYQALIEENGRLRDREDAVFAKGYRRGFFDGSGGTTAFNTEVETAHQEWDERGRKTHLDIARAALESK